MAHKTLMDGTDYEIIANGMTLVNGTAYCVTNGKTLVDETVYDIELEPKIITVSLYGYSMIPGIIDAWCMINGIKYTNDMMPDDEYIDVDVPVGTVITCHVLDNSPTATEAKIKVNFSTVASGNGATYEYTVPGGIRQVTICIAGDVGWDEDYDYEYHYGGVDINAYPIK